MDVDEDEMGEEESGWKLIHGDVFRFPSNTNLFAALVGAGGQLCCTTFLLLLCAITGFFRPTKVIRFTNEYTLIFHFPTPSFSRAFPSCSRESLLHNLYRSFAKHCTLQSHSNTFKSMISTF